MTVTYYYVCDACAHIQPHPGDVGEEPTGCENCRNWSMGGPFADLDVAEEISEMRIRSRADS